MSFIEIKDALITVLSAGSALLPADRQFQTVKFQRRALAADEVITISSVEVFYGEGRFPKSGSAFVGDPVKHDASFRIQMMVAGASAGDLSGLENAIDDAERLTAMATFVDAASEVDKKMDQLWNDVWNILNDPRNETLGLTDDKISSRWVPRFRKDNPNPKGEITILTASAVYECVTDEVSTGETGTPGADYDTVISDINGDTEQKTGQAGTLGG